MKIAHISDSHFDERNRLDDTIAVHSEFLELARDEKVDLIVHGGDWFERKSSPHERLAVYNFLRDAADVAPVVGVRGNHDAPEELELFHRATVPGRVAIFERPGIEMVSVGTNGSRAAAYCLPWFDKQHLVAQLGPAASAEDTRNAAIRAARQLLAGIGRRILELQQNGAAHVVLLAHCMVGGSETSTGQVIQGITVELAPSDLLATGADYVALGHIHKHQEWLGGRVAYSGSPSPQNYGEPEQKGWVLAELAPHLTRHEFRPLPARKLILLEYDGEYRPTMDDTAGALVRVRVKVPEAELAAFDPSLWTKRFPDAHEVKVEPIVERTVRARAPEISTKKTVWEKVETYLRGKQIVDPLQLERLGIKLSQLEGPDA